MANSILWLTKPYDGAGNGLGYSVHNNNMYNETKKFIDVDDPHADWHLQVSPGDQFYPTKGKKNILFTMFEFPEVPENYKKNLWLADIVLVPCKFCQDIFAPYTKKLPIIVNEGVDSKFFKYRQRKEPDYTNGEKFRILWAGARNTRKGYQYATDLIKIMGDRPDIEIYIKTHANLPSKEEMFEEMGQYTDLDINKYLDTYMSTEHVRILGKHKNIFFDMRKIPIEELKELYNSAHVFLFSTLGEGWGLMGTEILSTGCPLIATPVTGVKDWFDAQVGYPLEWHHETIIATNYDDMEVSTYSPNTNSVIDQVFNVKDNYDKALEIGKRGSKRMAKKFRWEQQGAKLANILKKLPSSGECFDKIIDIIKGHDYIKLSLCIPTYNMGSQLKTLLQSIKEHNRKDIEICISDNCSDDNTKDIIDSFDSLNIKYECNDVNLGFDKNIDNVVNMASAEYVWLLGADDMLLPDSLNTMFNAINKDFDICLSNRTDCNIDLIPYRSLPWVCSKTMMYEFIDDISRIEYLDKCNSVGGIFSYITNLCFKKEIWVDNTVDDEWFDSGYIHIKKMFDKFNSNCNLYYLSDSLVYSRQDDRYLEEHGEVIRKLIDFKWFKKLIEGSSYPLYQEAFKKVITREHNKELVKSLDDGTLTEYIDYFYGLG